MKLLLIRHGETTYNTLGIIYGHAQVPLNERGQQQAHRLAQRLKNLHLDAVYSSDLIRAIHTAEAILAHHAVPHIKDTALRELDVGLWEHKSAAEVEQHDAERYAQYLSTPGTMIYPGGDSHVMLQQRVLHAINHYVTLHQEDDVICIVCHAGTIAAIICAILGININLHERIRIDNCAITTIMVENGALQLVCLNDNTHTES